MTVRHQSSRIFPKAKVVDDLFLMKCLLLLLLICLWLMVLGWCLAFLNKPFWTKICQTNPTKIWSATHKQSQLLAFLLIENTWKYCNAFDQATKTTVPDGRMVSLCISQWMLHGVQETAVSGEPQRAAMTNHHEHMEWNLSVFFFFFLPCKRWNNKIELVPHWKTFWRNVLGVFFRQKLSDYRTNMNKQGAPTFQKDATAKVLHTNVPGPFSHQTDEGLQNTVVPCCSTKFHQVRISNRLMPNSSKDTNLIKIFQVYTVYIYIL